MISEPLRPLPAATLVPMRDGQGGLEVLLLRRSERAAFVPGGHVFPGGVVDAADASADAAALVVGLSAERASERLDVRSGPPALAYFFAAVRETFEESGLLVGVRWASPAAAVAPTAPSVVALRADLLDGRIGFTEVLARLGARVAADELAYFAHWITPERAPRRYDTRFFAARVPPHADLSSSVPAVDPREMTSALWSTPAAALEAHAAGTLAMILPTIETLRHLATFPHTRSALASMASAPVATNPPASASRGFAARPAQARLAEP
ncbi:MAG: NUDIX hydrolase [Gemmatimonadales bacterium]